MFHILLEGHLAYMTGPKEVTNELKESMAAQGFSLVSSDLHNNYIPFAADFGPVNLGVVHRFCSAFTKRLARSKDIGRVLVYCMENIAHAQANASFLLGAFLMINHSWTAEQAAQPFTGPSAPFKLMPFRDATFIDVYYELSLLSCLKGLCRALQNGWFELRSFNIDRYQALDDPGGGDIHQLCPKFIGFKGPLSAGSPYQESHEVVLPPEHYVPIFLELGVSCVIRLNEPDTYDGSVFMLSGINHHELYFNDCTVPTDAIVERFLDICDAASGAVAVHCRAGLGRTGTLVALWLMKHAGFNADEAMGWLRIVRPGSVIGPQQEYLKACEARGWQGNALLPPAVLGGEAAALTTGSSEAAAAELARQVTMGMCARGRAKAAASGGSGPGGPGSRDSKRLPMPALYRGSPLGHRPKSPVAVLARNSSPPSSPISSLSRTSSPPSSPISSLSRTSSPPSSPISTIARSSSPPSSTISTLARSSSPPPALVSPVPPRQRAVPDAAGRGGRYRMPLLLPPPATAAAEPASTRRSGNGPGPDDADAGPRQDAVQARPRSRLLPLRACSGPQGVAAVAPELPAAARRAVAVGQLPPLLHTRS